VISSDANGFPPALAKNNLRPVAAVAVNVQPLWFHIGLPWLPEFHSMHYSNLQHKTAQSPGSFQDVLSPLLPERIGVFNKDGLGCAGHCSCAWKYSKAQNTWKVLKSQEVPVLSKKNLKKHVHDLRNQLEPLHGGTCCVLTLHRLIDWCGTSFAILQ